jgi:hypothetical protein
LASKVGVSCVGDSYEKPTYRFLVWRMHGWYTCKTVVSGMLRGDRLQILQAVTNCQRIDKTLCQASIASLSQLMQALVCYLFHFQCYRPGVSCCHSRRNLCANLESLLTGASLWVMAIGVGAQQIEVICNCVDIAGACCSQNHLQ